MFDQTRPISYEFLKDSVTLASEELRSSILFRSSELPLAVRKVVTHLAQSPMELLQEMEGPIGLITRFSNLLLQALDWVRHAVSSGTPFPSASQ